MQERDKSPVLFLNLAVRRTLPTPVAEPFFIILMPWYKILGRGSASSIKDFIWIDSHNQLRIPEQVRNIFFSPVANILCYTFHHIYARFFALNDDKWNTIHQHNNIRTDKLTIRALYFKLIRYLKRVIFRMLEINIVNIKRLTSPIREIFLHAFSGAEKLIDFLIGGIESRSAILVYRLHSFGDRTTGEKSFLAAKLIGLLA